MVFQEVDIAPKVMRREKNPDFGEFFKLLKDPSSKVFLKHSKRESFKSSSEVHLEDPQFENFLSICNAWDDGEGISVQLSLF